MVLVMITVLSLITSIAVYVLVKASQAELNQYHRATRVNNQEHFKLINNMLSERLVVWVETFSQQSMSNNASTEHLTRAITQHYDMLRLQWQVEGIWIANESGGVTSPKDNASPPEAVRQLVARTRNQIRPMLSSFCDGECRQLVSVPVLISADEVAIVVVATALQEMVALLSQSTNAKAAVVASQSSVHGTDAGLAILSPLNQETAIYMQSVLDSVQHLDEDTLVLFGALVKLHDSYISVSLLPLDQANSQGLYVVAIQDETDSVEQFQFYKRSVFASAVLLLFIFVMLTLYLFARFRMRLMNLSRRLPLLAKREFEKFKQQKLEDNKKHLLGFTDELDTLENATENLASQLEHLDIQNRKNLAKLEKLAMYDSLTELPNRNMLNFQIEKRLSQSLRNPQLVALMFIDIDDFKKVNDGFGHEVGDTLLQVAGQRIVQTLRESDITTRFGGDEFVILLSETSHLEQIEAVASKLIKGFSLPLYIEDKPFYMSISIGIAITKGAELSSVELLKHADIAMYEAKGISGSAFKIYDASMNAKLVKRLDLEAAARAAMLENQFSLAMQPILNLQSQNLIGFEALLRWHHPERGMISPGEFIPVLENTSFMLQLDYWVIARTCRILRQMAEHEMGELKVAINLSASQFTDPELPNYLQMQIDKYGVKPSNIEVELTETALVADMSTTVTIIKRIQALGCRIAIDDFGTGYASLSYLKNIPANTVKLDQSFIAGMMENQSDRNIVYAAISMVKGMGMQVVGEGIERASQFELLCHFGCDYGQGYLINRPIDEDKIWKVIDEKLSSQGVWDFDLPSFDEGEDQIVRF